jgi:hypothetical protein
MFKLFIIFGVIIVVSVAVFLVFFAGKPNLKEYEYLREPQIRMMQNQKMITIEVKGDPNEVGKKEIRHLFKTFYQLKSKTKGLSMSALRGRWPNPVNTPKNEWIGIYGLPVPDSVQEMPAHNENTGFQVTLEVWEYGAIAEILHIGPYSDEQPTIQRLHTFIEENGYEWIEGGHEEEYLKGPGMFFKGNPKNYYTIIRQRIKKKS